MKIIGNAPNGDLIVQVSQAEWKGLQDGVRPKDDVEVKNQLWEESEAGKFLAGFRGRAIWRTSWRAFQFNKIDGSLQSLRDLADGKVKLGYVRKVTRIKLKQLLEKAMMQVHQNESGE